MHRESAAAPVQRGFNRLGHPRLIGTGHPKTILDDVQCRAEGAGAGGTRMHPGIALRQQMLLDLGFGEVARHLHRKAHHQPGVAGLRGALGHRGADAGHSVAGNWSAALSAMQAGGAGKEQLQMVVQLGHGADRRARGANRIGLIDRDGRWHAFDPVDLRLVHAVEELPRIRREGLDIATLALGIKRVEDQRGFS